MISGGTQVASAAGGDNPLTGMERGQLTRQEVTGAIPVNVAAEEGPGGLGAEIAMNVGINSRRASADSLQVQVKDARFIRQKVGGELSVNTAAIVSTDGFRKRGPEGRGGAGSNAPQTEESVELGLVYLVRCQLPDGSWSLQGHDRRQRVELSSDTAATALSVLAFQGAGYNHREHKYKEIVEGGIQYLVKNQRKDGDLFVRSDDASNSSAWLYSHALGTLALCEAYGMTGDPALREPAQKAIDFIVASQSKELGGWRYRPREMSDTSVTGWMMMALKSGELANLDVPAQTYAGVKKWLDLSDGGQGKEYLFRYDPSAPDTRERRHGRVTSKTMTSVGLLMRLYLGWKKDGNEMRKGADFLLQNPPHVGTVPLDENNITKAQRDTYYWYYTTLVMYHMGGEYRERWLGS
ncbi:MAG TPA: prenyltransferase/squalene oxidase repeat-containing protein, partial [Pirellulaceae bacterium]|nr:prenyltransferase/squalene oxidase repeat-containing protein [Pirellulaceae bacterium]